MTIRRLKWTAAALAVVAVGGMVAVGSALAHSGGMAKDGCHMDRAAGALHHHAAGTREVAGPCERAGDITIKTVIEKQIVEVAGPVKVVEKEVRHVRVQKFEAAMDAIIGRLEAAIAAEANRAPRVVEVEKIVHVKDPAAASAACVELRNKWQREDARFGGSEDEVARKAIERGCW